MLQKIDINLLNSVSILSSDNKQQAIVYFQDYLQMRADLKVANIQQYFEYPFIKACGVYLNIGQIWSLAYQNNVQYICSVSVTQVMMQKANDCIHANIVHDANWSGQSVGVAVIDTGCYPHIDFCLGKSRIIKFIDFVNNKTTPYDDNGHGTFVTGVLAGSGMHSGGKYSGVACGCDIIALKALNNEGQTQAFRVLDAMQWIYDHHHEYNIRVVCMSFGSTPLKTNDPLCMGANALWDKGLVVVCAGGNDGPKANSIKSPGSSAKVITVGSADTTHRDIKIADFSSRGPIFDINKPDVVAPGVNIVSLANNINFYTTMSGTSISTPMVAGVVALMLQKIPILTPNQVKSILLNTSDRLPFDINISGAGVINCNDALNIKFKQ